MKFTYKAMPVLLHDIPGLEAWLEDMANQDLFPVSVEDISKFKSGAVPGTRFRLEPKGKAKEQPSEDQLELYRQYGWEYALSIGGTFFLFYTTDPAAPELYTDPAIRGMSLDRLAQRTSPVMWSYLIYPLIGLVLLSIPFWLPALLPFSRFDVQPDRWAILPLYCIKLFSPIFLFLFLCVGYGTFTSFRNRRALANLHKRLTDGLPPKPSPGPSRALACFRVIFLVCYFVYLLITAISLFEPRIPLEHLPSPYISLSQLECVPLTTWEPFFEHLPRHSTQDGGEYSFSLLAPTWYTVSEERYFGDPDRGYNVITPDPKDETECYKPELETTVLHLTIPAMARPVAKSLLYEKRLVNLTWTYEELDYPGTDFVILGRVKGRVWQLAAVGNGGRVAVFRYAGQENLADHLDTLAALVAAK